VVIVIREVLKVIIKRNYTVLVWPLHKWLCRSDMCIDVRHDSAAHLFNQPTNLFFLLSCEEGEKACSRSDAHIRSAYHTILFQPLKVQYHCWSYDIVCYTVLAPT